MEYLRASVDYDGISADENDRFNLVIHRMASANSAIVEEQEIYSGISLNPDSPDYVSFVLLDSDLVFVEGSPPVERPECTLAPGIEVGKSYVYASAEWSGPDGITDYDLIGNESEGIGLFALNQIPSVDYVCPVPDEQDLGPIALLAIERYCRKRCAILAVDPPSNWTSSADITRSLDEGWISSTNIVTYFPRPAVAGGSAPGSAIAAILGRLAAREADHGIGNALPAGPGGKCIDSIRCRGTVPFRVSATAMNMLARNGINYLVDTGTRGIELQGLVTFSHREFAATPAWHDLRSRRIALFIADSISRATRWTAFDDDSDARTTLEKQLRGFLRKLYTEGALSGATAEDSYDVAIDRDPECSTFTVAFTIDPNRYHLFRFSHDRVDCEIREIAWQPDIARAS